MPKTPTTSFEAEIRLSKRKPAIVHRWASRKPDAKRSDPVYQINLKPAPCVSCQTPTKFSDEKCHRCHQDTCAKCLTVWLERYKGMKGYHFCVDCNRQVEAEDPDNDLE